MAWGQAIGAAIGATAQHIESALGRHYSSREARAADSRSYRNWQKQIYYGPRLERQGLELAGYNPMLAINGGLSSASMPSTHSGSSSGIPDIVGGAKQGADIVNAIARSYDDAHKKAEAEINNINADSALKDAQRNKTETDRFDNPLSVFSKLITDFLSGDETSKNDKVNKAAQTVGGLFGHSAEITDKAEKIGDAAGANLYGSVKQIADKVEALKAERESKRLQKRYEDREKASPRRGGKKQFDPYKANGGLVYGVQKEYNTNRTSYERRHKYKQPIRRVILH